MSLLDIGDDKIPLYEYVRCTSYIFIALPSILTVYMRMFVVVTAPCEVEAGGCCIDRVEDIFVFLCLPHPTHAPLSSSHIANNMITHRGLSSSNDQVDCSGQRAVVAGGTGGIGSG